MNTDPTPVTEPAKPLIQPSRKALAAALNKARRIRNKILRNIRERRGTAKRRVAKDLAVLRRGGVEPSAALRAAAKSFHNPVPRALQGQVKQAGRTRDRFQSAQIRAKARQKELDKETAIEKGTI